MSEATFVNWRRFGKKLRHIQKLGRYMAYIGHYLDMLRRIGQRPSRAELVRMRRAMLRQQQAEMPVSEVPPDVTSPNPRADPEPEPQ